MFLLAILFLLFRRCLSLNRMKTIESNVGRSGVKGKFGGWTPGPPRIFVTFVDLVIAISILSRQRTATFRIAAAYRIYIQLRVSWTTAKLVYQYLVEKKKRSGEIVREREGERDARGDIFL